MNPKLTCSSWLLVLLVLCSHDQARANPLKRRQPLSTRDEGDSRELRPKRGTEAHLPLQGPDVGRPAAQNRPPPFVPRDTKDGAPQLVSYLARSSREKPPPFLPLLPRAPEDKISPYQPRVPRPSGETVPPIVGHEPRSKDGGGFRKPVGRLRPPVWGAPRKHYPGNGCFGHKLDKIGAVSGMGCRGSIRRPQPGRDA
uniref:Natriuretic/helokinestatin-Cwar1 n=1 Tax=Caribicus warreni TaxID=865857 RepID=E2E4J4_CARWR|nr:natriuretic/helokinestatin-Cwar1 [Caribicus warreni]